jgi:hypothetical protein
MKGEAMFSRRNAMWDTVLPIAVFTTLAALWALLVLRGGGT